MKWSEMRNWMRNLCEDVFYRVATNNSAGIEWQTLNKHQTKFLPLRSIAEFSRDSVSSMREINQNKPFCHKNFFKYSARVRFLSLPLRVLLAGPQITGIFPIQFLSNFYHSFNQTIKIQLPNSHRLFSPPKIPSNLLMCIYKQLLRFDLMHKISLKVNFSK